MNVNLRERLWAEHCEELLREMEQRRLLARAFHRPSLSRRMVGRLGKGLVSLGSWLERIERRDAASTGDTALFLSGEQHL